MTPLHDAATEPQPEHRLVLFLHIAKTAGTAVIDVLTSMFPPGRSCQYFDLLESLGRDPAAVRLLLDIRPDFFSRYDLIVGHLDLNGVLVQRSPRPRLLVSVLREPLARVISLYDYARQSDTHPLHLALRPLTLHQALRQVPEFAVEARNAQLRQLFGSTEAATIDARLNSEPHVIGRTDRLGEFLSAVERLTGRRATRPLTRQNEALNLLPLPPARQQPDFATAIALLQAMNQEEVAFFHSLPSVLVTRGGSAGGPCLPPAIAAPSGLQAAGHAVSQVSQEAVVWAMRLFIGREPHDEAELAFHQAHPSLESLRTAFAMTPEFRDFQRAIQGSEPYRAPLFLLQPPAHPAVPWRLEAPSLAAPVSQLCTAAQVAEPSFEAWCAAMACVATPHRKVWEFAFILAALESAGMLQAGARGLGFGVGQEPLPALFASRGIHITATDAPIDMIEGHGWDNTGQHASGIEALSRPAVVADEVLRQHVQFQPVDMNAIPATLTGFDFCWSSCALEHLGSIAHGLDFIEASLGTLRPGGLAVHTTEFNLSSNEATFENPMLSLFRKRDFEALAARLVAAGHQVMPLNFHPGDAPLDEHIDLPPYAQLPHLKLAVSEYVTTSIGFVVRRGG